MFNRLRFRRIPGSETRSGRFHGRGDRRGWRFCRRPLCECCVRVGRRMESSPTASAHTPTCSAPSISTPETANSKSPARIFTMPAGAPPAGFRGDLVPKCASGVQKTKETTSEHELPGLLRVPRRKCDLRRQLVNATTPAPRRRRDVDIDLDAYFIPVKSYLAFPNMSSTSASTGRSIGINRPSIPKTIIHNRCRLPSILINSRKSDASISPWFIAFLIS